MEVLNKDNQLSSEKVLLEKDIQSTRARITYLEEQIVNLTVQIQKLQHENFDKNMRIDELNLKASRASDHETELQSWKNRYEEIQKRHAQDMDDLRTYLNNSIREDAVSKINS